VPILGALASFAVTGIVFLVTQARNVPNPSEILLHDGYGHVRHG
jgi:hypothetical protein